MKEYEIYVPLFAANGLKVPKATFQNLKRRLIKRFGGLTSFPQKAKGAWKTGGVTFHDEIVILRVLSSRNAGDCSFWKTEKQHLEKSLGQDDVLIVVREVRRI